MLGSVPGECLGAKALDSRFVTSHSGPCSLGWDARAPNGWACASHLPAPCCTLISGSASHPTCPHVEEHPCSVLMVLRCCPGKGSVKQRLIGLSLSRIHIVYGVSVHTEKAPKSLESGQCVPASPNPPDSAWLEVIHVPGETRMNELQLVLLL